MKLRLVKSDRPLPEPPKTGSPLDLYLGQIIHSLYEVRNRVERLEKAIIVLLVVNLLLGAALLARF